MAMTIEQQRAMALARARLRRQEAAAVPSAADATAARNAQVQEQRTAAEAPPAQTWGELADPIVGFADQVMRGAATGITNMIGLPGAMQDAYTGVIDAGLEAAGAPDFLRSGLRGIREVTGGFLPTGSEIQSGLDNANDMTADALGLERPRREPRNMAETVGNRVAEEIGAMAVPATGAIAAGRRLGVEGARQIQNSGIRSLVEPAAVNPGRYIQREATISAGAGLGAATLAGTADRDTLPGALLDAGGAVAGAGLTGLGMMAARGGLDVANAAIRPRSYDSQRVQEDVTNQILAASGLTPGPEGVVDAGPLISRVEQGRRVDGAIPGFQESLADRTQNPGIANLEYGRQSGVNSGTWAGRRADNTRAIDAAMDRSAPQGNPGAFREELALERDRRLTDAQLQAQIAEDEAADAIMGLQPGTTSAQRGNTVRTGLEDARDAARQRTEDAYNQVDISGREVDPSGLTRSLDEAVAGLTEVERRLVPQGLIDSVASLGRQVEGAEAPAAIRLKEATDLKSQLQHMQRAAMADPRAENGGRNAARVIGQMVDTVDGFIAGNLSPEELASLGAARGARFDEAERFGRAGDPVADALARREGGQPRVRDDQVAGRFTNAQAMDRLFAEADTPAVRQAIQEEVLSNADLSSEARIRQFSEKYSEQLDKFPGLRERIETAASARGREASARGAETDLRRMLGDDTRTGRSAVGQYLKQGDENADRAMRGVMNSAEPGKAMDELLTFVNDDPAAVEGARKVFWDIMQKSSRRGGETTSEIGAGQPWMPQALTRFLDDPRNAAVAGRLYRDNPEQLGNVRQIAEALQGVDIRNSARAPNTSGTAQSMSQVLSPETLQSRYYAMQTGRTSLSFMLTSIASVATRRLTAKARDGAFQRIMDDALMNPETAAALLKANNPANRAALAKRAKLWFGNQAASIMNAASAEDENEDDTAAAVMREDR